jgi:hypothetical protein
MALTASRDLNRYVDQELRTFPVAASERVWKGALVGVERTTGSVRNLVAGDLFAGIAYEEVDNSDGGNAEKMIRLYTQGDFVLPAYNASQAWVGAPVYAIADDATSVISLTGASYCGILISVTGSGTGIIRIQPLAASQTERSLQVPLASSTSGATTNPVLVTERAIKIISLVVSFITAPDQGNLDIGTDASDPDEIVNAFDLSTLAPQTPTTPTLGGRDVDKNMHVWAKVGQASSTAGVGGLLSLRYVELP